MNILFTCAGRRNYLIAYFRQALGGQGKLLAGDCSVHAAALQEADEGFILPAVQAPEYIDHLLGLCVEQEVKLLVPLNDHELPILARARHRFSRSGIEVLVSSPEVIELTADKLATARFAEGLDLHPPLTLPTLEGALEALASGALRFPLIVKPRWGTASLGVERVDNREMLELAWQLGLCRLPQLGLRQGSLTGEGLMIQGLLPGQEYGLDIVNDLNGNYRATFVKRKLSMRAGETERAVTEIRPELAEAGRRIGESLRHRGNLDCDVFFDGKTVHLLELNPRFGGGYPFSAQAGADLPAALIAWTRGEEPAEGWASVRPGITSSKCDRLVCVGGATPGSECQSIEGQESEALVMPFMDVVGLNG
ncbi:ATP-grasp domain-containing protein [Halomonas mongoliensis]|uniref:ATP-grasp domain-containing protein n=1 Tax=Halomonas mongoliensis TaxID=321265 RepID=UPI00403B3231